mmetsp:Transcript_33541/g.85833  ORF Transcript_33541/g.85833 Transcript_33541/m.85833 type:complete len:124 (+) Transcript_33541:1134-1505(+)
MAEVGFSLPPFPPFLSPSSLVRIRGEPKEDERAHAYPHRCSAERVASLTVPKVRIELGRVKSEERKGGRMVTRLHQSGMRMRREAASKHRQAGKSRVKKEATKKGGALLSYCIYMVNILCTKC